MGTRVKGPIKQRLGERAVVGQDVFARVLLLKGWYVLLAVLVLPSWENLDRDTFAQVSQRWPRDGGPIFLSHFATWDAPHYLYLSEVGYTKGVSSCAFYPLWPLLVRWSSPLTGGSHLAAGLLLSNVCSVAAWLVFHRLVAWRWGRAAASLSLAFLILSPGSLFFQFHYTESLFLLLVMLLWWGLEERRHGLAAGAALLLPLTRAIGVFAVLPIAAYALEPLVPWVRGWWQARRAARHRKTEGGRSKIQLPEEGNTAVGGPVVRGPVGGSPLRRALARSWLVATPLAGWAAYLALMWHWTGNPFEGFQAQKHWGDHCVSNLWNLPKFVIGFFSPTDWHAHRGSVLDRLVFTQLSYCLPVIWRLDWRLLVWTYALGIVPAMSGTFISFARYSCCAFPMFIALGVFFAPPERRWLRYGLLAVFGVLHAVLVWRFVNFRWAG